MSTIKKKFNIWTVLMFLGCLALSIIITQPILARADGTDYEISAEFSPVKIINAKELYALDFLSIGHSNISESEFDGSDGYTNTISLNKIKIGEGNSDDVDTIFISGSTLYGFNDKTGEHGGRRSLPISEFNELVSFSSMFTPLQEWLVEHGFGYTEEENGIDVLYPLWEQTGRTNTMSFKNDDDSLICSENNAGTVHYVETYNGSKLIVCMKINDREYTGAVIKEYPGSDSFAP